MSPSGADRGPAAGWIGLDHPALRPQTVPDVPTRCDDGPSRTVDVATRIERDMRYQSVYRDRLIAAGVIRPAGHGLVELAVPYLGEYLREHAARYEMADRRGR
ncbi:hypothetical protein [Pseudokineococcus sp. 1T1Z-3]|uniref:hypothetical protein n=1 Tax=Pseudokineococcus sp. 1T1Z-3 TaxID=3132745 RepID=UPI0030A237CA